MFILLSSAFDVVESVVLCMYLAPMWEVLEKFVTSMWPSSVLGWTWLTPSTRVSLVFFAIALLVETILHLPWNWYLTFVIEARHGFNRTSPRTFVLDTVKSLLLSWTIGIPVLVIVLLCFEWGPYFYLYVYGVVTVITLFFLFTYHTLIAPCFNTFTPLESGPLRDALSALAHRVHFPLTEIYIVDGSSRSAHSNAYFYGFFRAKRIVLYDTLVQRLSVKDIEAVIAHELGHYAHHHFLLQFLGHQVEIFVFVWLFSHLVHAKALYHSFGFSYVSVLPIPFVGLLIFSIFYTPLAHLSTFIRNLWSRHMEYQADRYAVYLGYDLREPLKKLHEENASNLLLDPLYAAYHHSHPSLVERTRAITLLLNTRQ
jgi:STE24 endopeptidase